MISLEIPWDPSEFNRPEGTFNSVLNGENIAGEICKRICKDGSVGKHILSANPVYIDNKIVGMEGFILDLSGVNDKM